MAENTAEKIKVTQVPPDRQESPLIEKDEIFNEIYLMQDRWRKAADGRLSDLMQKWDEYIDDMADAVEEAPNDWKNLIPMFRSWLGLEKDEGSRYPVVWRKAIDDYGYSDHGEENLMPLWALTGKKYELDTIRGCSQSDWADLYHLASWSQDDLDLFAAQYFNTGDEWMIECPDGSYLSCYTTGWNDDMQRQEILDFVKDNIRSDAKAEDLDIKAFTGYSMTPEYRSIA